MNDQPQMRLAFRQEGKWWVAYMARLETMAGATPLGRIRMTLAGGSEITKQAFMDCMKVAFSELVKGTFGKAPTEWETRTAPEHERSGNA